MKILVRILGFIALASISSLMIGCASPAPKYSPPIDNVEAIKRSGSEPAKVETITVSSTLPGANSISLRAESMTAPSGNNFGDYIASALRTELELARLHNPLSPTAISGVLLKNNINAGGFSTNDGQIEVRFTVKRGDQLRYDKTKQINHQWESSFLGAVAIPAARNNYPVMVQKLITELVNDPEFVKALKN